MKEVREEIGSDASFVGYIVKSRERRTGHMVRMKEEMLPKKG